MANLNQSGIYCILNRQNKKAYIGSAINLGIRVRHHFRQLRSGKHGNRHLQNAFNKYGEQSFSVFVLDVIQDATRLIGREQFYIDTFKPLGKNGYNLAPVAGSLLGTKRPPLSFVQRERLRIAMSGTGNPFYGKTHTDKVKQIISEKTQSRMADPRNNYFYQRSLVGEQNGMYGRTHSPESRAKIGASSKGRTHSNEAKQQMSITRKGKPQTHSQKAVIQLDMDGCEVARYASMSDAANKVKRSVTAISYCVMGKTKVSAGYRWRLA